MLFQTSQLSKYPEKPGVYLMKGTSGQILYIGKANHLRNRIRQYFNKGGDGRWIIPFLQEQVAVIDTVVTASEKEALLLENNLIKKHKPHYNALLKDDKTYTALKISTKHPWPMLTLVRHKGKLKKDGEYFGPYPSGYQARQTLDLLQKIFPMRQCSDEEFKRRVRPCILYDMKRCSGPCVGLVSHTEYDQFVQEAKKVLKGQTQEVIKSLESQMEQAAENLDFEKAGEVLSLIRALGNTMEKQVVEKAASDLSADSLAIFRQGSEVILSQLTFEEGRLSGFQHHDFKNIIETDEDLLESFILQNYKESLRVPKEILLPLDLPNAKALEEILDRGVKITTPQKGARKALVEMAYRNAEASFSQKKDQKSIRESTLSLMQESFHLARYPRRIECIDTSHLSGTDSVSSLVSFDEGEADKKGYRKYKLRSTPEGDDYGALNEVLKRRYKAGVSDLPDLLIIDGGKGHLNMAIKTLAELNIISVDLIGVAKEEGRHDKGSTREQVFLPERKDPILLPFHSQVLFLLQRIRDEAHRFAITYQKLRRKKTLITSELAEVEGIGPILEKALLRKFGSVKQVREASDEALLSIKGMTQQRLKALRNFSSR